MARATIRFHYQRGFRGYHWVPYLTVLDADGRCIRTDNGGTWQGLLADARRDVGAMNHLERIGHRTKRTWHELVDEAEDW